MTNVVYAQPYRNELGAKIHTPTDETKKFVSNIGWLANYLNCCFCCKSQAISTPSMDKLKEIYQKNIASSRFFDKDSSILERQDPKDLCKWSNRLLTYLPVINTSDQVPAKVASIIIEHLNAIKSFYVTMIDTQMNNNPRFDSLFKFIQIYECVMSIGFIAFQDYPETIKAINDQLAKAEELAQKYERKCFSVSNLCGQAAAKQINMVIENVDRKIGQFNLARVAEFLERTVEIFCNFVDVEVKSVRKIYEAAELIDTIAVRLSESLVKYDAEDGETCSRRSKWAMLALSETIQAKANVFEARAPVVRTLFQAFQRFFKAIQVLEEDIDVFLFKLHTLRKLQRPAKPPRQNKPHKEQQAPAPGSSDEVLKSNTTATMEMRSVRSEETDGVVPSTSVMSAPDISIELVRSEEEIKSIETTAFRSALEFTSADDNSLSSSSQRTISEVSAANKQHQQQQQPFEKIVLNYDKAAIKSSFSFSLNLRDVSYETALKNVLSIGVLFQKLETILTFFILKFKNQEDFLYPLAGHIDECTRIIEKFTSLNYVYKLSYGLHFLSKLKIVVNRVLDQFENSKLEYRSPPVHFLAELKEKYVDLLYLLFDSFTNVKIRAKQERAPDPIEEAFDSVLDVILSRFEPNEAGDSDHSVVSI